jgi:hypothetical protein
MKSISPDYGWRVDTSRLTEKSFKGIKQSDWEEFLKKMEKWVSEGDFCQTHDTFNRPLMKGVHGWVRFDDDPWRAYGETVYRGSGSDLKTLVCIEVVGHKNIIDNAWVFELLERCKDYYYYIRKMESMITALKGESYLGSIDSDYIFRLDEEIKIKNGELIVEGLRTKFKDEDDIVYEVRQAIKFNNMVEATETGKWKNDWVTSNRDFSKDKTEEGLFFLKRDFSSVLARQHFKIRSPSIKCGDHKDFFNEALPDRVENDETYLSYPHGFAVYNDEKDEFYVIGGTWLDEEIIKLVADAFMAEPDMKILKKYFSAYDIMGALQR